MSTPTITHSAVLHFNSNSNEAIRITIPRAKLDITEVEARATMEAIITGGIVLTNFGRPAAVKGMEIVTTTRSTLV